MSTKISSKAPSVSLRQQSETIPTYPLPAACPYPMFFGKRVYQGSSGKIYPLPFHDSLSSEKRDLDWQTTYLENEFVRIMLLPELGGRIHRVVDKKIDYDIFYHQPVIKPALVGLAGPWISGGIEFNWPQHHRPTTYMPADCRVEEHADGSATVWLGEHDAMDRMKELHGVRIHPNSSRVDLHVRVYNRTPLRNMFMWWANVAAEVHENYQSFFPPDVHYVADHAVRAMSSFPIARNHYYGIDYRPGTDLTWYSNIPVPTSYMVLNSRYAFFGGYDHAVDAGFIHVADRDIAPGKKQWTWGNSEFGWAWDRELTDPRDDGRYPPYIELMAGIYTNNQPDFAYIAPYETKTFVQSWWPIRGLGPVQEANERAALRLVVDNQTIHFGVVSSEAMHSAILELRHEDTLLADHTLDLEPSEGHRFEWPLPDSASIDDLTLSLSLAGQSVLTYQPPKPANVAVPDPARAPSKPDEVESVDRLYRIGEHLEQYRHPTRDPEPYWEQALRRDPGEARCHLALGRRLLRRGLIDRAVEHLEAARDRSTEWHPNLESGEVFYLLGLAYRRKGVLESAKDCFGKAAWDRLFVAPARYQIAMLYADRGEFSRAREELCQVRLADPQHQDAVVLDAALLRHAGEATEALKQVNEVLELDPLCFYAWHEQGVCLESLGRHSEAETSHHAMLGAMGSPSQSLLDVAFNYVAAGLNHDALAVLDHVNQPSTPMIGYTRWWLARSLGNHLAATEAAAQAAATPRRDLFPVRPEEEAILTAAAESLPDDFQAPYLLGCLLYDRRRTGEAIDCWQRCLERAPDYAGAHRNLGLALFNNRNQADQALSHFQKACAAEPADARLVYELDQLKGRCGFEPKQRLAALDPHTDLVDQRDDLTLEYIYLLLLLGRDADALNALQRRRFHPWEGGEGRALTAHVAAHLGLGVTLALRARLDQAKQHFEQALTSPANLGEAKHPLAAQADIHAHLGWIYELLGETQNSKQWYEQAAAIEQDFSSMAVQIFSPMTFYKGWSLKRLGRIREAQQVFESLLDYAQRQMHEQAQIDYFATSLPNLLVFEDNLQRRHKLDHQYLQALAMRGLKRQDQAERLFQCLAAEDSNHLGARQMLRWEHLA